MPSEQTYRKLRIFIACPGGLRAEKDLLLKIVDRLQKPASESGYFLEPKEWRQVIGMGRPQQVIFDESQPERWDIFIGIIWMRFGSPPGGQHPTTGLPLESGTQEEFLKAYELWKEHSWPRILFYRCTRSPERLDQVDAEQLTKINNFFAQFDASGDHPGIYKSYSTVEEFDHSVYDDLRDLIRSASTTLNLKREVEKAVAQAGDTPAKGLVMELFENIEMLYEGRGSVMGLSTGFVELDGMTGGLHPGEMIVIAGHPGIGKTALVMNIVEHISIDVNKAVAVFSLETTSSALMQRLLSSRAKVDLQLIRAGFLSERDFPKLTAAASALAMAKLFIDDTPRMSLTVLRARAQQLKSQHDIQLIVVDYFQLLHLASRECNRQLEIAEISADLKQLAKELSAPLIIIAQLSQQSVLGSLPPQVRAPWLSDLWELGSLERDADLVGLLLRAAYYATEEGATIEVADEAELIVPKQRNGPTGAIPLTFFARHARFETRAQESPTEA